MAMKIVISEPKTKKAYQVEKDAPGLTGLKIGDSFDGSIVGLSGFKLQITGGSDKAGFPMRSDLEGTARKKALLTKSVGFRGTKKIRKKKFKVKGLRRRKYIRGNKIADDIAQVNCKVLEGQGDIPLMLGLKKEEAPAEEPKEEKKDEQPKEEPKPEENPEEKPEEEKKE